MNKYKRRVFASFLVGVMTLASLEAAAADPDTHPLSREHVNLVRVQGQKITDVVYDTQALEITADKARGHRVREGAAELACNGRKRRDVGFLQYRERELRRAVSGKRRPQSDRGSDAADDDGERNGRNRNEDRPGRTASAA